jgi:hypothetical protein
MAYDSFLNDLVRTNATSFFKLLIHSFSIMKNSLLLKILFLCFFQYIGFTLSAQSFVTKLFASGSRSTAIDTLESGNVFLGFSFESGTSIFDNSGNLISTRCYENGDSLGLNILMVRIQSTKKINDDLFAFCTGTIEGSCNPNNFDKNPLFGTMDSNGEILSSFYYVMNGNGCSRVANDLIRCINGDFVLWGLEGGSMFVLRCTAQGALVWAKNFDQPGGVAFVKELPNEDLLVGHNLSGLRGALSRLSHTGEILWTKGYNSYNGSIMDGVIHDEDSFTVIGFRDSLDGSISNNSKYLYMMRLNGQGQNNFVRAYRSENSSWYNSNAKIVITSDNKLAILSTHRSKPILMKLDMNGDTIWTRSYYESGYYYSTMGLFACSNGSLMYNFHGGPFHHLVRTDPQGYLPCNNFYNRIAVHELIVSDTNLVLTSVDGAQVFPAQVTPTPCEDLGLQHPCIADPLAVPDWMQKPRPRILPNPTPGRITVDLPTALLPDSFYSVFDATGRLLYERPLPPGTTTTDIDLSRFGTGTYLLRITEPDGQRNERVVVE